MRDRNDLVPKEMEVCGGRRVKVRGRDQDDLRLSHGRAVLWKEEVEDRIAMKGS